MKPVISIHGITKRFGRQVALDNLSLDVPPGVVFALLGENGAGKTTAIRILLGLAEADKGQAQVLDLDSHRQGLAIRRRVGYLPEQPTLYEWMTVHEIGWFTAGFYGGDRFMETYLQLTDGFSLPRKRKVGQLSKGMRAKVALSLAMAHRPELLILDEPTSGLDTMVRREFLESMVDIAAEGRTVLLSSHQIAEVERVADIVAMIHEGQLLLVEPLDKLKRETQQLTITLADGATSLPEIPGQLTSEQHRRQWQVVVRGLAPSQLEAVRSDEAVAAVESRSPTLEEIFVAYMRPNGVPAGRTDDPCRADSGQEAMVP